MSTEQKFLDNLCKILGHALNPDLMKNDFGRMTIDFEKTCSRCNRSGKVSVKYIDVQTRKFGVLSRVREQVEWNFNTSPHKKL